MKSTLPPALLAGFTPPVAFGFWFHIRTERGTAYLPVPSSALDERGVSIPGVACPFADVARRHGVRPHRLRITSDVVDGYRRLTPDEAAAKARSIEGCLATPIRS